uniref:Papilin b, proteoglycan-like sulfated glycoprotein n=1 Tax=Poecilia latipinna TaxID=48699 RepID=A0A3B3V0C8_9TELE
MHSFWQVTQPVNDYWGEFGPYGPCSRTCGTGVAMRTRRCITSRTDGGHNCVGSSKSFLACNTHACPVGSKDFREEQCSEFDRMDFQGKRHRWVPYYGASNPCELNCVPRGQNFFYRHRPTVVDGTPCYVGRTDICVDGVCRVRFEAHFFLKRVANLCNTRTYMYRAGVYGECSATCDGGMQYRSVECWVQHPSNPHVVDESYCITQRLQRPQSQQACNMHPCAAAEFSVSSFSACSRSCGGGVRERKVGCFDADLNPFSEDQCGFESRPTSVETCNAQPCNRPQSEPNVDCGVFWLEYLCFSQHSVKLLPYPLMLGQPCVQSLYGCCPDGHTTATGPRNQDCTQDDCVRSRYGCCLDGVTPAAGFGMAGCPEYQTPGVGLKFGNTCLLPRDEGPCDNWMVRFTYDYSSGKCKEFWYGGCHGNANNFRSMEACRTECEGVSRRPAPARGASGRGSLGSIARATAQRSRIQRA